MPLTEFVRMYEGKVDMTQEETSPSPDHSSRPDTDCLELVWEDGQIMMQGKSRRNYVSNNFQTFGLRPQDGRNANGSRMTKFGSMESLMGDFPLSDPSCGMGLDQDVDLVPWLSFPMEEPEPEPQPLHNDYTSDFMHELSGVTINNLTSENHSAYRERKSSFHGDGHDASVSLKHENTSKGFSSNEKDNSGGSSELPQYMMPYQHSVPRSDFSDITGSGNDSGNVHHIASQDSILNPSSLSAFTSLRLQKLEGVQPSTSSGFTNFPCFSRPASLSRANSVTLNPSKRFKTDDKRCTLSTSNPTHSTLVNLDSNCSQKESVSHNQSNIAPANGKSEALPAQPAEGLPSANQPVCREDIAKKPVSQNQACDAAMGNLGSNGNKNMEPVVAASSVCSGNSAERASNEPAHNLKRKSPGTADSEGPSEEVEEESVGAKKTSHGRNGSKRSRAAEVHNLSERRRRDRINEKMRSLQELIPNCNKADKASMLDEAIEYLKTLQLQVQMLSMGAGMYMHPMMLPPGLQSIHGAHMPQFSPMGLGMGMGMGFGMNMLNMNNGTKMAPFQGPHYPIPGNGSSFQGMPVPNLQAFAHPGQGLPMPMQQAPIAPGPQHPCHIPGSHVKTPMGLNVSGVPGSSNEPHLASSSGKKDANPQALPSMGSTNMASAVNQATNQGSNEGIQQTANRHDQPQGVNVS